MKFALLALCVLPVLADDHASGEAGSGEAGSGDSGGGTSDLPIDVYTILAIVFLSCLGLLLLVRLVLYFVACGVVIEETAGPTRSVIKIEGTGTCGKPDDERV